MSPKLKKEKLENHASITNIVVCSKHVKWLRKTCLSYNKRIGCLKTVFNFLFLYHLPGLIQITYHCTVGFWCQKIHKKFLRRFDTIFGLKMMVKSCLEKIILRLHNILQSAAAQSKNICPQRLNWPDRLAGISEGHR